MCLHWFFHEKKINLFTISTYICCSLNNVLFTLPGCYEEYEGAWNVELFASFGIQISWRCHPILSISPASGAELCRQHNISARCGELRQHGGGLARASNWGKILKNHQTLPCLGISSNLLYSLIDYVYIQADNMFNIFVRLKGFEA